MGGNKTIGFAARSPGTGPHARTCFKWQLFCLILYLLNRLNTLLSWLVSIIKVLLLQSLGKLVVGPPKQARRRYIIDSGGLHKRESFQSVTKDGRKGTSGLDFGPRDRARLAGRRSDVRHQIESTLDSRICRLAPGSSANTERVRRRRSVDHVTQPKGKTRKALKNQPQGHFTCMADRAVAVQTAREVHSKAFFRCYANAPT